MPINPWTDVPNVRNGWKAVALNVCNGWGADIDGSTDSPSHRAMRISPFVLAFCIASQANASCPKAEGARVNAIRATMQHALRTVASPSSHAKFGVGFVDLNGDGVDEAIVYGPEAAAPGWCGTGGCGIGVYVCTGSSYRLKSSTSIGWPPVGVLRTAHYGWRDITIVAAGGGIVPGYRAMLTFNGSRYPFNPTTPPAGPLKGTPSEMVVIQGLDAGIKLLPLYP